MHNRVGSAVGKSVYMIYNDDDMIFVKHLYVSLYIAIGSKGRTGRQQTDIESEGLLYLKFTFLI